jgi:hypothetical protein
MPKGKPTERKDRYSPESERKDRYSPESAKRFNENLERQMAEFQAVVSGLPPLPKHRIEFEGWFNDVKKRLEIASQTRTTMALAHALRTFNRLREEWLKLGKIEYEISRIGARAEVEDLEIKLKEKQLKLEMAKVDAELRELKTKKLDIVQPTPAPQAAPSRPEEQSLLQHMMRKAKRYFDAWDSEIVVKEKIIEECKKRGQSEEDAKAFADEIIEKIRKEEEA